MEELNEYFVARAIDPDLVEKTKGFDPSPRNPAPFSRSPPPAPPPCLPREQLGTVYCVSGTVRRRVLSERGGTGCRYYMLRFPTMRIFNEEAILQ
eukprot:3479265-Rhodomonas_salina.1